MDGRDYYNEYSIKGDSLNYTSFIFFCEVFILTIKQLYYFLKIAEAGSFTRASQILNVSQPPLSYQIKLLEEELETDLFIRNARTIELTEAGIYLQIEGKKILEQIDKLENVIKLMSKDKLETLNIGTVTSINHDVLPDIVKRLEEKSPNVQINIYDGSSDRIQQLVDDGKVEIGIIREPFNHSQYNRKKIKLIDMPDGEDDYMVAVGKQFMFENLEDANISFDALMEKTIILHRRFEDSVMSVCKERNIKPYIVSKNENIITSIDWVMHGLGVTIMPYSSANVIKNQSIIMKKIVDPILYSNLYVIWKKDYGLNDIARRVVDLL